MNAPLPVRKKHCKTCPFLASGLTEFRDLLTERAMGAGTPVCHSTGHNPELCKTPDSPVEHACRGARDVSLRMFTALGLLPKPTDQAWADQCRKMGMQPPPESQI